MKTNPTTNSSSQRDTGTRPCKKPGNFRAVDGMQQTFNTPANVKRPIVILGPTTVGKTEVAFGLARRLNAAVINADKFYLYDALPEVTGQSDADQYPDVTSHLYGRLQPDDPLWSVSRYRAELRNCLAEAAQRNQQVIVEGCSNALIRVAIETLSSNATSEAEQPLIMGLQWKHPAQLPADCERRAGRMFKAGMPHSFDQAYRERMQETYLLRKCFAREPLLALQRRSLPREACQQRVAELLERHARRHHERMSRIPKVAWLDHDRRQVEATVNRILTALGQPTH
jgi:tRNA A37 N6-isopentenylltransferase MiaA